MELYRHEISDDKAYQYFREHKVPDNKYMVIISAIRPGGKKTVHGLHVSFYNVSRQPDCEIKEYSWNTPCVRVHLSTPTLPTRKQFEEVVFDSISAWKAKDTLSNDHPYYAALTEYQRTIAKKEAA